MGYATKANGWWGGGRPALPREHGSVRGVRQHRRLSEKLCAECKTAHAADVRARYWAKKSNVSS